MQHWGTRCQSVPVESDEADAPIGGPPPKTQEKSDFKCIRHLMFLLLIRYPQRPIQHPRFTLYRISPKIQSCDGELHASPVNFMCFYGFETLPEFRLFFFGQVLFRQVKQDLVFFIYILIQKGDVCSCMIGKTRARYVTINVNALADTLSFY